MQHYLQRFRGKLAQPDVAHAAVAVAPVAHAADPALEAKLKEAKLEYVIDGLGVTPEIQGVKVTDPEAVRYHVERAPDQAEMLDGLADVAYTMYWNANAFGVPLEAGYELVCDNNLEKFVKLDSWAKGLTELSRTEWHCRCNAGWPDEVVQVAVVELSGEWYAVGKDARGKVRKPLHFKSVDLSHLL